MLTESGFKLSQSEFDILQTIANTPDFNVCELPDLSGWNYRTCVEKVVLFKKLELIEKSGGRYYVTTKGKLTLAILAGQQRKRTYARKNA